ncbi:MATE family efflux transporter [Fusobacterium mortiferum ATCC 9817]|uniref:MATE family efflux transporter n=1 Tax=Fusobacterium mortiferum ATCC 9817 TaxID=469616 RepID=A0ABN5J598_FUSMR|nr:MATE family efflux transporter [Fusobacterium mortiferum ATCC 9817]
MFTTAVCSLLSCGILISILITIFMEPVINFLGGGGNLYPYVKDYLSVIILFCVCYMTGYALEIYIKVDGNPVYPTLCVITGGVVNILLDYIFVVIFHWGIKGAAFATGLSQVTTTSLLFYYIFFRTKRIKFVKIKYSFLNLLKIMKVGFAEFLAEVSTGISIFVFNLVILKNLGEKGVSAFGIIGYISSFITMTMIGFNQGVQPILSFNLGAKEHKKIFEIIKNSFFILGVLGIFFYTLINIFSANIVSIFLNDVEDINLTKKALTTYSFAYLICGFNIFSAGYFTAVDMVKISTIITMLRGILLLVLFILILPIFLGTTGIWITMFVTEGITLIFSYIFMKKYNPLLKK